MPEENDSVQADLQPRGSGFVIAVISLVAGWGLGMMSMPGGDASQLAKSNALQKYVEPLQDPRERELIEKLNVGDDLSTSTDLRMLADDVIRPEHGGFAMIYDYYSNESNSLPTNHDGCEILYFDLRTQEYEGVRSYYIITRDCEVLAICEGESVTI